VNIQISRNSVISIACSGSFSPFDLLHNPGCYLFHYGYIVTAPSPAKDFDFAWISDVI
jgi:hypothetical protein